MQTVEPGAWPANGFADETDRTGKTKRIRATPAIVPRTSLRRGRNCPDCGGCVSWCSCPATTGVPVASDRTVDHLDGLRPRAPSSHLNWSPMPPRAPLP